MTNEILFFDTETTGIPPKGCKWDCDYNKFPYIVQIAWSIGKKERSYIIRPNCYAIENHNFVIPKEAIDVHGITNERAKREGRFFNDAIHEFLEDCKRAKYICAHNIYFDTSVIKANILRFFSQSYYDNMDVNRILSRERRIDTMMRTRDFVGARFKDGRQGKFPRLEELYAKLFNGEKFPAHDAWEDVAALRKCFEKLVEIGIVELEKTIKCDNV